NFDFKWALCFDELEIAPEFLQKELITSSLRSRDQKILFKLTTLPLVILDSDEFAESVTKKPSNRNDYNIIRMWLHDKPSENEWQDFSDKLFASVFYKTFGLRRSVSDILGSYNIDTVLAVSEPDKFGGKRDLKINRRESITYIVFKE